MKHIKLLAVAAAATMLVASFAGCGGSGTASSGSSSKGLDAQIAYAKNMVNDYSSNEVRLTSQFADQSFNKAYCVSMMTNEKASAEDFEKVAKYAGVDSIVFADETGKITASYPDDLKGKSIKEVNDIAAFNRLVKGVVIKLQSDPISVEGSDAYKFYSGVPRADGTGAVVVSFTTDDYAEVTGADLAKKCGVNTVVLREDKITGATLTGASVGGNLDSLGVKDEDIEKGSFSMTVADAKYDCKAEKVDDFVVICAVPA